MRLYEVQKALEEGNKIRRQEWPENIHLEFRTVSDTVSTSSFIAVCDERGFISYFHPDLDCLLVNDWEIVVDIPEVQVCISEILSELQDQINDLKKEVNILKSMNNRM